VLQAVKLIVDDVDKEGAEAVEEADLRGVNSQQLLGDLYNLLVVLGYGLALLL
jgi:hypothetical protein